MSVRLLKASTIMVNLESSSALSAEAKRIFPVMLLMANRGIISSGTMDTIR